MKLKKTKKDIIEAIKSASLKKKNEMFEINSKVQAVAPPSFVNALEMSAKNKQMVIDRMKEKEKERKELEAQTVERKANETPKTDAMKKMKMVEEFVNASFKDRLTISENIFLVKTTSRVELKTLIENAKKNDVKYSIGRTNEGYEFKYKFEILNESKESRVDVEKCRDIMKNKIDWTDVDASGDVSFAIDQVRSMRSENVISDDEYDYIMSNWDKLQESKKLKEELEEDTSTQKEKKIGMPNEVDSIDMTESKDRNKKLTVEKAKTIAYDKLSYGDYKNLMTQDDEYIIDYVSTKLIEGKYESKSKTIKEGLADSKYKALIGEHFDHSFDFEFLDIVAHTLDRIDFESNEELSAEDIDDAVNDALIYTADQWTVAKFYASSPADLDWNDVLEEFSSDISQLADKIAEGTEGEEDEEDEELERLTHLKDLYDIEPGDLTEDEIKELQDAGMLED